MKNCMKNLTKLIGLTALVAVIGFAFIACDDGNKNPNDNGNGNGDGNGNGNGNGTNDNATVYVAGYAVTGNRRACYWKDGVRTILPSEESAVATGIAVLGDSIYVIGVLGDNFDKACYWKNGVLTFLPIPEETSSSFVAGITVSDGSVYILGNYYYYGDGGRRVCYWKDGVRTDIPDVNSPEAFSIAVSGGSVYLTGYYISVTDTTVTDVPCYWKDGVRTDLPPSTMASAITVSGGSVYIAGLDDYDYAWGGGRACYWKDGVITYLSEPEGLTGCAIDSIAVSGGSVYVTGYYNGGRYAMPFYWKDGVRINLPLIDPWRSAPLYDPSRSKATKIALLGNSVYILGIYVLPNSHPLFGLEQSCYWKDGKITNLPLVRDTLDYYFVYDIAVVPK